MHGIWDGHLNRVRPIWRKNPECVRAIWSEQVGKSRREAGSTGVADKLSETGWIQCRVAEREKRESYRRFEGHGGASNLSDIIHVLRARVETKR
jgi:hypothetical protein